MRSIEVRGPDTSRTAQNPMTTEQVEAKARDILVPDIGAARAERLIGMIRNLEELTSVRELRPLLMGA